MQHAVHNDEASGLCTEPIAPASDHMSPTTSPSPADRSPLGRKHARRLREIYRSAGWPCQDVLEIELLAAGMLQRIDSVTGHETLRVTDAGVAWLAAAAVRNRSAMSKHEALVERVALEMVRAGRIAWRGLGLRARLPPSPAADGLAPAGECLEDIEDALPQPSGTARWCVARPDVFSIRNTTVETYADPIVHEIKVHRADLLADLRRPDKCAAYLDLGGACWYVLGADAQGRPIGDASEITPACGVLVVEGVRLVVARAAPARARRPLPFAVWLTLAKATPVAGCGEDDQAWLAPGDVAATT